MAFLVFSWSFGSYVLRDNGDTMQQRAVTWFRNHGLGRIVEIAEGAKYRSPPSKAAAEDLALAVTTAAGPTTTVEAPTTAVALSSTVATPTTAATPTTTTIPPHKVAPANLIPVVAPPLAGEGVWTPIARAGGVDAVWAASIRPLAKYPSVVGTFAIVDQTNMTAAMFNGSDIPGGTGWALGNRVPDELHSSLRAGFNGGFRFEHIKGGYKTEGRVVRELKAGEGTLALTAAGKVTIGEFGRDVLDDGKFVSMRQNLPLLVDGGLSMVDAHSGTWWGADYGDVIYVLRSSVCQLADGRIMYGAVGKVDAHLLAASLASLGCQRAMQLDINGTWPTFFTFPVDAHGTIAPTLLDRRMGGGKGRYLTGSTREFFAFFDSAQLPPQSVLTTRPA